MDWNMKYVKRIVAVVIYVLFAYFYAFLPDFSIKGGFSVSLNPFNQNIYNDALYRGVLDSILDNY